MMARNLGLAIVLAVTSAGNISAQTAIELEDGAIWQHRWTALTVPQKVAGFERTDATEYIAQEYNVAIMLSDAPTETSATLYVFKPGVDSLPIWADRAATAMLSRRSLGQLDLEAVTLETFAPPFTDGQMAGFRVTAPIRRSANTSTGLAIFSLDGWIVKLRMTSARLDVAGLTRRMDEFLASLPIAKAREPSTPFVMIENCAEKLKFEEEARIVRMDMTSVLLAGSIFGMARKAAAERTREGNETWCREAVGRTFAAYRLNGEDDWYVVAFGDAGVAARVAEVDFDGLIDLPRAHYVAISNGATEDILPPFNRMPGPGQVAGVIGTVSPITSIDLRPGSEGEQTIILPGD